jgi:hypothetical protein
MLLFVIIIVEEIESFLQENVFVLPTPMKILINFVVDALSNVSNVTQVILHNAKTLVEVIEYLQPIVFVPLDILKTILPKIVLSVLSNVLTVIITLLVLPSVEVTEYSHVKNKKKKIKMKIKRKRTVIL